MTQPSRCPGPAAGAQRPEGRRRAWGPGLYTVLGGPAGTTDPSRRPASDTPTKHRGWQPGTGGSGATKVTPAAAFTVTVPYDLAVRRDQAALHTGKVEY